MKLIEDPVFRKVTVNTLLYLVLGVPLTMALALGVAVLLNRIVRLKGFFRVGYYLPVVTSIVAVSVVWKYLYRDNGGVFNTMLVVGRPRRAGLARQHDAGAPVPDRDGRVAQLRHR